MRFTLDGEVFELTRKWSGRASGTTRPSPIREYWVEIDGVRWPVKQVISLATGVRDRQRFQSQSSRRWLASLGFVVGDGLNGHDAHTAVDTCREVAAVCQQEPAAIPDVVLVGCVKSKLDRGAPAKDLYVSDYFRKMRAYAERAGVRWFILSAEHGLVGPETWVEPYERYLPDTSREYRRAVGSERRGSAGPRPWARSTGVVVDIHAGSAYVESAEEALRPLGAVVVDQLQGLSFGRRLSWYLQHDSDVLTTRIDVAAQLRDRSRAVALDDLLASGGPGLRSPGCTAGGSTSRVRAISAAGLGHEVAAGLIYAGPGWCDPQWRLEVLEHALGANRHDAPWQATRVLDAAPQPRLDPRQRHGSAAIDEADLTRWMQAHLRVVAIPIADADTLDALESDILAELDPPLNLAKVRQTPLRARLSALRAERRG